MMINTYATLVPTHIAISRFAEALLNELLC